MRRTFLFPLMLIATQPAYAHVLEDTDSLLTRLAHQLAGAHHLPLTLALIAVGILVMRRWHNKKNRQ